MEIREILDKETWEGFISNFNEKTFLQSWSWGEFQLKQGNKIWRLGIYNNDLTGLALVVKISARRGTFLFIPHGPIVKGDRKEALSALLSYLSNLNERASFIRISPFWERKEETIFKSLGFRPAPIHMHAEVTWELDLSPSEEALLAGMRKTTRYLIRKALENKDIEILRTNNLNEFLPVYHETSKRHKFVVFSEKYLQDEISAFGKDISVFLGKYKGEVVSAAIFVFWQGNAFYHHSGSLVTKAPVSYLLQWEAIKEAKKRGCKTYNFWGISTDPKHPWAGLSQFKMGFGGYQRDLVKSKDYVLSFAYWPNYIIESLRKIKRGF